MKNLQVSQKASTHKLGPKNSMGTKKISIKKRPNAVHQDNTKGALRHLRKYPDLPHHKLKNIKGQTPLKKFGLRIMPY